MLRKQQKRDGHHSNWLRDNLASNHNPNVERFPPLCELAQAIAGAFFCPPDDLMLETAKA
jgi:hypothetical protein